MSTKKYLSLERLSEYDNLIKTEISSGDSSTLTAAKTYADNLAKGKADSGHNHNDTYYTESETDTLLNKKVDKVSGKGLSTNDYTTDEKNKLAGIAAGAQVNTITGVKGDSESTYRTGNVNITKANIGLGNVDNTADANKSVNYATSAGSATNATKDANGNTITATYETKNDATAKLSEAKTYADNAAKGVKDALLNGAGAAYDTLKELGDLIATNVDAIDALEEIASGKANATHSHAIADVTGLQSALDGKAASSHGTHVTFDSTNTPKMNGTAAFGTSSNVARADHVHPTDTSRAAQTALDSHTTNTTAHITATERTNWGTAYTHSQAAHAPSNAQANVIESIKVNGTAQTITSKAVNITVPTKTSDLTHDSGFLVASDIANKADKSTTLAGYGITNAYTKAEVDTMTSVDSALSSTSTKPVQNKVVNSAISTLTTAVSANTSSVSAHSTAISNLQTAISEIQEITSAEIQALFA